MAIIKPNVNKREAQLKLWDAKLDLLMARAEEAGDRAKVDHRKRMDDIQAKRELAKAKMDEFGVSGVEKWEL